MKSCKKKILALTCLLIAIVMASETCMAANSKKEPEVTDVTEVFGKSFNEASKLLGMEKRFYREGAGEKGKSLSASGEEDASYISNVSLPEYEDTPNVFSVYILDKDYNVSGVTIGTKKEDVDRLLISAGWEDDMVDSNSFYHYHSTEWTVTILYEDDMVDYMMIQVDS